MLRGCSRIQFTSGSTGEPKGVALTGAGVLEGGSDAGGAEGVATNQSLDARVTSATTNHLLLKGILAIHLPITLLEGTSMKSSANPRCVVRQQLVVQ